MSKAGDSNVWAEVFKIVVPVSAVEAAASGKSLEIQIPLPQPTPKELEMMRVKHRHLRFHKPSR